MPLREAAMTDDDAKLYEEHKAELERRRREPPPPGGNEPTAVTCSIRRGLGTRIA